MTTSKAKNRKKPKTQMSKTKKTAAKISQKKPDNTKPASTKPPHAKPLSSQAKNDANNISPMTQSLRERVQMQVDIIAEQKKQLVSAARKQVEQAQKYSKQIKALTLEQKAMVKKLKENNSEKITELKQTSKQQIHQANKDIARLQQEVSAHEDTDKDKTIKQLSNSRKLLQDRTSYLKITKQQLLTVQNFVDSKSNKAPSGFTLERFILKLLSVGYHRYARIHYLNLITESDWKGLLSHFQSQTNGFDTLETMRPLFLPWIQYYHALIDVIHDQGYTIRPMEDYYKNGDQDKSIYMYHDVHAWDILPALGMALANKDRGIGTTFLLNIDQAQIDLSHEAGYRIFGTLLAGKHVSPGLHCNPFATWVRMDIFKGDEKVFMSWIKSETSAGELKSLIVNNRSASETFAKNTKTSAKAGTLEQLDKCFQKLQSFIPQAISSSHHGDILNSLYKKDDFENIPDSIFTDTLALLRDKTVEPIGIKISPTAIQKASGGTIDIYSEMPNKARYFENLHEALSSGQSVLLINHPGAISNIGLTMNLDFVRNLKNSKYKKYQPVSTPLQSPTQMRANNDYIYDVEN